MSRLGQDDFNQERMVDYFGKLGLDQHYEISESLSKSNMSNSKKFSWVKREL